MEWLNLNSKESEMCLYWHLVLNMQLQKLTFIRSMREGILKHVESMRSLMKWCFYLIIINM